MRHLTHSPTSLVRCGSGSRNPTARWGPRTDRRLCIRPGLTLLDVTLATLIIGILSAVVVPRFSDFTVQQRLQSAVQKFQADLQFARRHAMATTSDVVFQVDITTDTYTFRGVPHPAHPNKHYHATLSQAPWHVRVHGINFDGTIGLEMNGAGIPAQPGKIEFVSGAYSAVCTIQSDGRVSVEYSP